MTEPVFPFSAVVGQNDMKQALKAVAVDPEIGGVLVKGPRGTGKSTLARSLTGLLPEQRVRAECPLGCDPGRSTEKCPFCESDGEEDVKQERPRFVDLPLGATPDQVIGSLSLKEAVNEARKRLNPGLLARAHRGILYVDEVNLLPDRLVDLLLDVAASGVNRVERDGLSVSHPSEFILIGTMNPEEGRLRPQLRDRFGLSVWASNQTDPSKRQELARRASAFKSDPESFREDWESEQEGLREIIRDARNCLPDVKFNEGQPEWIARRVLDSGADGHRADVVIRRTAKALAALDERTEVHQADLEEAFELAIEHRRSPDPPGGGKPPESNQDPFGESNGTNGSGSESDETVIESREDESLNLRPGNQSRSENDRTSSLKINDEWETGDRFSVIQTLRNRARRFLRGNKRDCIRPEDVCFETIRDDKPSLLLWVLDTSASMARNRTIGFVKSVVKNARNTSPDTWTGLVDFRGRGGSTVVPPTRRNKLLLSVLDDLPVAGETPFAEGLVTAQSVVESFRGRHHGAAVDVVIVSDGRVTLTDRIVRLTRRLGERNNLTLVDAELDSTRWGMFEELASAIDTRPIRLKEAVA